MSYSVADHPQELDEIVIGKARDYDIALSFSSGSLAVADITDAWFTVKRNETDADVDALITKRLGAGITFTGAASGVVSGIVQLTNANTAALPCSGVYFFDLQVDTTARGPEQAAHGTVPARLPITIANS